MYHNFSLQTKTATSSMRFWLRFSGIISIIFGAIYCLTIIGAVFGWLPILMGLWMIRAGDNALQYLDSHDEQNFFAFVNNIRNLYLAIGILFIVQFSFLAIYFIFIGFVFVIGIVSAALGA